MIRRPPRSTRTDTSFPTRRSSDLIPGELESVGVFAAFADHRGRQPAIDGNLWLCRRLQHVGHLDPVADLVNVAVLRWKGLIALAAELALAVGAGRIGVDHPLQAHVLCASERDRKSTRLNSSH